MDDFKYDKNMFVKYCRNIKEQRYSKMTKSQLTAALTIDYHRIEKGLAMQNCTPNFGVKPGVLRRIYTMNTTYINKFNKDDKILKITYYAVLDYFNWHKNKKIKTECPYIELYLKKYKYLIQNTKKNGGIYSLTAEQTLNTLDNYDTFFRHRRSVRKYSTKNIEDGLIEKCIYNAIYGTPTVCNRPINKVYIIKNFDMRKKVLSLQNGNRGFGLNAPVILIITTNLENFQNSTERRQPYIGGGMFAMSIIYTLHAKGLATCCLNWDVGYKKDIQLKKIMGLTNENIIMFISVGHYSEQYDIAISDKPNLDDVMKVY